MVDEDEVLTKAEAFAPGQDLMAIPMGTEIGGYIVDGDVGRGGMGVVYSATHPVIGKRAAIKVLRGEVSESPGAVARFIQEARAVNKIGHPNIVDIFAFGTLPDGRAYHVMDLLVGEPLRKRLKRGRLSPDDAAAVIDGVASALIAAHDKGFVHRDLKPDNIYLVAREDDRFEVRLLDFGLAKLMPEAGVAPFITKVGAMLGTPEYMAPEQARGEPVDARTDIYSLGVLTFEILTGYRPFGSRNSAMATLKAHAEEPPPHMSDYVTGLDAELIQLVEAMLAKRRDDRPSLAAVRTVVKRLRTRATTLPPDFGAPQRHSQQRFITATSNPGVAPRFVPAATGPGRSGPGLSGQAQHPGTTLGVPPPVRASGQRLAASALPPVAPTPTARASFPRWLIVAVIAIAVGIGVGLMITGCSFTGAAATDGGNRTDARPHDASTLSGTGRKITFLDQASAAPLVGFPVLLRLDASTIDYAMITNPRTQLAFADPDNTPLPFDIDTWNPNGESDVWVRVPQIDASNSDYITLRFGPGVTALYDPALAWASEAYVVHLGSQLGNAGGAVAPPNPMNVGTGRGIIGEASTFAGTGTEKIDLGGDTGPLFNLWNAFTLELWVYPDYATAPLGEPEIVAKGNFLKNGRLITAGAQFQLDVAFGSGTKFLHAPAIWQHWNQFVYTYDGAVFALYHDGVQVGNAAITETTPNSGNAIVLGGTSPITGAIDELHVAHVGRNADWIRAEYLAAMNQFTTITAIP